jgi:altronate dehydratase small subunit
MLCLKQEETNMASKTKAVVIHPKDNVATALCALTAGARIIVDVEGTREIVVLSSDIPLGHKFAMREIPEGQAVIKYGEPIGQSTVDISRGEHVHVHNVISRPREGGSQ